MLTEHTYRIYLLHAIGTCNWFCTGPVVGLYILLQGILVDLMYIHKHTLNFNSVSLSSYKLEGNACIYTYIYNIINIYMYMCL